MLKKLFSLIIVGGMALGGPVLASGGLVISVTQGKVEPIRIAIADMQGSDSYLTQLGKEIASVIENDLSGSGMFKPLNKQSFLDKELSVDSKPKFAEWRTINSQSLVLGKITKEAGDKYRVEVALYDVNSEKLMGKVAFTHTKTRRIAHKIADYVFTHLTGEQGYFDTQIVYVTEQGFGKTMTKRLILMDQDGKNSRPLSGGGGLVMTPRFAPNSRSITFLDFGAQNRNPRVYLLNPDTNSKTLVGNFPGMTFAPRFSPDGGNLVMSLAKDGNSCLYAYNLRTKHQERLTFGNVIDTSPSYSPDGRQIVFNSNRGGQPQIYLMDSNGKNLRRISFEEGSYRTPVWSPRGDYIAFVKMWKGNFYIGVMKPDGTGERLLTQGYVLDDPIWSANGRMIMYSRQERGASRGVNGHIRLNIIDLTGTFNREIPTLPVAYSAAWSPPLP